MSLRVLFLLPLAVAVGCQRYSASPLDAERTLVEWRSRSADLTLVRGLAESLAARSPATRPAFDASNGIDVDEAELIALVFNPTLRKARLEADVARVGADESGRWEDPSIGVDLERIVSSADDPWVIGGLVNLTIPLSGRLGLEKKWATSEANVAHGRVLLRERELIAELRTVWADWSTATLQAKVLEQAANDLSAIDASTAKLRDAGELDPAEARLFTIDLVQRRSALQSTRRETARLESSLRALMGLSPEAKLDLRHDLSIDSFAPATIEQHPQIVIAKAEYEAAERSLALEVRKQFPDLHLGLGAGSDQGDSRLLGGVSIPLPLLNSNRKAIAEARAKRDVARAEFESQLIALTAARELATRDLHSARVELELIERDLIPLVYRQLLDARKLLDAGEFNPLLVREAIDSAVEAKLQLLVARQSLQHAIIHQCRLNEVTP